MQQLDAAEYAINDVLCSKFDFEIPDYQRPYAWRTEDAVQLLDDLSDALQEREDEPYFLGSIVLIKTKNVPKAFVIDGQQRLTTLNILLAILRDLTDNDQLRTELAHRIQEPGSLLQGNEAKPRLKLRERDAGFFAEHVQTPGATQSLCALEDHQLANDAQKAVRNNARALRGKLEERSEDERLRLATMVSARTFLVVVSTADLASAHRIFSVMNARGLDLSPADIFKSRVIGDVAKDQQSAYADTWEDAEVDLGRQQFADMFLHVRMIYAKERGRRELLKEFQEQVLNGFLPDRAEEFVNDVVVPYAEATEHIINLDYAQGAGSDAVNAWLQRLKQLDNNDWRPAALWALRHHRKDPGFLETFLDRLERLAATMLLRRVYATPRATKYADLLKELEDGQGLNAPSFRLTEAEREDTRKRVDGELYLVAPVRKYALLRLDEHLAKDPGVSFQHKLITVEHVLPQHPAKVSQWLKDFTDEERDYWTHRLANLVLLNRSKNSAAQNYDFAAKKDKYFRDQKGGIPPFSLTIQVIDQTEWTPAVLEKRQKQLTQTVNDMWRLGSDL